MQRKFSFKPINSKVKILDTTLFRDVLLNEKNQIKDSRVIKKSTKTQSIELKLKKLVKKGLSYQPPFSSKENLKNQYDKLRKSQSFRDKYFQSKQQQRQFLNSLNLNNNFNELTKGHNKYNEKTFTSNNSTINYEKDPFFKSGQKQPMKLFHSRIQNSNKTQLHKYNRFKTQQNVKYDEQNDTDFKMEDFNTKFNDFLRKTKINFNEFNNITEAMRTQVNKQRQRMLLKLSDYHVNRFNKSWSKYKFPV